MVFFGDKKSKNEKFQKLTKSRKIITFLLILLGFFYELLFRSRCCGLFKYYLDTEITRQLPQVRNDREV